MTDDAAAGVQLLGDSGEVFRASFVAFNGPFRTGLWLDTERLTREGYADVQERVLDFLTATEDGSWRTPNGSGTDRLDFDVDTYGGRPLVPFYFLERRLRRLVGEQAAETIYGITWVVRTAELKVFDFGVGVITIMFDVSSATALSVGEYRTAVEAYSRRLSERCRTTIDESLNDLQTAIETAGSWAEVNPGGDSHQRAGELAWVHRILFIHALDEAAIEPTASGSWELLPAMPHELVKEVRCEGMLFVPGIGSSFAVFCPEYEPKPLRHVIELPERVLVWCGSVGPNSLRHSDASWRGDAQLHVVGASNTDRSGCSGWLSTFVSSAAFTTALSARFPLCSRPYGPRWPTPGGSRSGSRRSTTSWRCSSRCMRVFEMKQRGDRLVGSTPSLPR